MHSCFGGRFDKGWEHMVLQWLMMSVLSAPSEGYKVLMTLPSA
jgi:hypothetical protein